MQVKAHMNMEDMKKLFWRRVYILLLLAPGCLWITGQGEDARTLIWLCAMIFSGSIMLHSSFGSFTRRSFTQYSYFLMFMFLTASILYMSAPINDFSYAWLVASPLAVITALLSSLFLTPSQADQLIPASWLEIIKSRT